MNKDIKVLKPSEVWKHFHEITQVPRPSKKEQKAVDFVYRFGKSLGLETIKDEVGNVIIRKPATPGKEATPGIILQTHLDMVPEKNSDKVHDFEKDPITAYIDGDWVTADGTTLGADNGIGVAATMAVLESKTLKHGLIEALFTIDEETGMTGAQNLKPGILKGSILINLDSEDEGELYVGCAGGMDATFKFKYLEQQAPAGAETYKISVTGINPDKIVVGMKGGHSGIDINLGRGNANKVIFRILKHLQNDIYLSAIDGGSARNAIPRESFATVVVPADKINLLATTVSDIEKIVRAELQYTEPDLKINLEKTEPAATIIEKDVQLKLINAVYACPNGVIRMSDTVPGLVETSTNLAIVKSGNGEITVSCLIRSSLESAKEDLAQMEESVFSLAGAKCEFTGSYPGWNPNPDSLVLSKMKKIYKDLYGEESEVKAIHAGLECGLLGGIYSNLDMISCGPTIRHPHSPDEKVNIKSVEKWWNFLVSTLENI
ncbi:MAG: aminoacyl-histidine dipeptidase [Prevotellaceae bacterium]|jgi:dipeptidase D|nr:aminoacyl-histidine dipeptidase [Prevotellaceae bacterium]